MWANPNPVSLRGAELQLQSLSHNSFIGTPPTGGSTAESHGTLRTLYRENACQLLHEPMLCLLPLLASPHRLDIMSLSALHGASSRVSSHHKRPSPPPPHSLLITLFMFFLLPCPPPPLLSLSPPRWTSPCQRAVTSPLSTPSGTRTALFRAWLATLWPPSPTCCPLP